MNDGRKFSWKWLAILLVVVGLVVAARSFLDVHGLLTGTLRLVDDLGPWGPVLFVLLYVLATVLFVPAPITTRLYREAGSGFTQSGGWTLATSVWL